MSERWSMRTRAGRMRAAGSVVFACGVLGAAFFYWRATSLADAALNDTNALGYQRSFQHGMGVMMGKFGLILTDWYDALTSPAGEAVLIVLGAAIVAAVFFRIAWLVDHDAWP